MNSNRLRFDFSKTSDVSMTDHKDYNVGTKDTILAEMNLSEEDEKLYKHMIDSLEKFIVDNIKKRKCVSIPYVGCLSYNLLRKEMRNNPSLKIARKQMEKEEYKKYAAETYQIIKDKHTKLKERKVLLFKTKRLFKKKYEELYNKINPAYANAYIYAMTLFEYIPFNEEWENKYQELKKQNG